MESDIDIRAPPNEVLRNIDAMYAEHRLSKLRELADQLSWAEGDFIGKNIVDMTAEELIIAIWERNRFGPKASRVLLPPELTFGEPYDTQLPSFIKESETSKYYIRHLLSYAYRYVEKLRFYIIVQLSSPNNYWAAVHTAMENDLPPIFDPARKLFPVTLYGSNEVIAFMKHASALDVIVIAFHLWSRCPIYYSIPTLVRGCLAME